MVIETDTNRWSMVGNGVTTDLPYDNKVFAATDIRVFLDGVEQPKLAGYTVTNVGDKSGGNVSFTVPPAAGVVVVALRDVPSLQGDDLVNNQATDYELIETIFDRTTILIQQVEDQLGRQLALDPGDPVESFNPLPQKASLADKLLGFDTNGEPVAVAPTTQAGTSIIASGSTTPRLLESRFGEWFNVRDHGAVGDDATDETAAFAAARAAAGSDRPIIGINGDFNQAGEKALFGATNPATSDDALGFMMYLGSDVSPTTRHEPLIRLEKFTNSDRSVEASAYDQGALYVTVTRSGTPSTPSPAPAVNFYARAEQDANVIGAHMRGAAEAAGASAWGGWSYAQTAVTNPDRLIAHEFNLRNTGAASAWDAGAAAGAMSGIVIATADSSLPCTHGIRVADITSGLTGGFRTAINIDESACVGVSGTLFQDGEAIYIAGGATVGERIGAVRLGTGNFLYGISTHEATINNACAVLMADNHRLSWGTEPNSGSWLSFNGSTFDFNGPLDLSTPTSELRINGTKVVDAQITGWTDQTATASRADLGAAPTNAALASFCRALYDDLKSHGLIAN